jgi:hypothetical protein
MPHYKLSVIAIRISSNFEIDPDFDPDPDFRETLRFLNENGFNTMSSCQGHPPGTQYEDVNEWMFPYLTFDSISSEKFKKVIDLIKSTGYYERHNSGQYTELSKNIVDNWKDFLLKLKQKV